MMANVLSRVKGQARARCSGGVHPMPGLRSLDARASCHGVTERDHSGGFLHVRRTRDAGPCHRLARDDAFVQERVKPSHPMAGIGTHRPGEPRQGCRLVTFVQLVTMAASEPTRHPALTPPGTRGPGTRRTRGPPGCVTLTWDDDRQAAPAPDGPGVDRAGLIRAFRPPRPPPAPRARAVARP